MACVYKCVWASKRASEWVSADFCPYLRDRTFVPISTFINEGTMFVVICCIYFQCVIHSMDCIAKSQSEIKQKKPTYWKWLFSTVGQFQYCVHFFLRFTFGWDFMEEQEHRRQWVASGLDVNGFPFAYVSAAFVCRNLKTEQIKSNQIWFNYRISFLPLYVDCLA